MPSRIPSSNDPVSLPGRELWGTERFWHFAHHEHQGAFDMVSIFVVDVGSRHLSIEDWRKAWSKLYRTFAVLSQKISDDSGEGKIVDGALRAEESFFTGPILQDDQDRIDYSLQQRRFDCLSLTVFATSGTEHESFHLAISNPHALGDAKGIFAIGKALIQGVLSQTQAELQSPTSPPPQPSLKAFTTSHNQDLGLKAMFEVARKGSSIGFPILPKETSAELEPASREWRRVFTFSPAQTETLVQLCKAKALTVSAWLQATILHALIDTLVDDEGDEKAEQTFTVAAMPFHSPLSVSGATSTIFAPISIRVGSKAELNDIAEAVAESFGLARRFAEDVQDDYVKTLLKLFGSVRLETSVPTFSSLGRLDTVTGLKRYHVVARNNLPTTGIHAWTLNDQLNLTLSWAPARFRRDHIEKFWSTWIGTIKEVVA